VPLAREAVAFALWPDTDEKTARARLRWHLHTLQQSGLPTAGGMRWIISDKRTLQWSDEAPAAVDVIAFDRFSEDPADFAKAVFTTENSPPDCRTSGLRSRENGDRAGAMQTYHEFVERLRAELEVEPMAETLAAYDLISSAALLSGADGAFHTASKTRPLGTRHRRCSTVHTLTPN
jgi:DNA-binding SARP family transcriptional activator